MGQNSINCIFCGKESKKIAWVENGFTGKRCECGLLYVSPRPDSEEILKEYNSDRANQRARSRISRDFAGRLNARHRLKLLKKYVSGGSLLEVGCGGGYFLDESRRAGFSPFGVELNLQESNFIREVMGIPVETQPFTRFSFDEMSFDVICHFDVISHLYDPVAELETMNQKLKEGGILFFETGNGGDLSERWLRFLGHLQYPEHLFLFSKRNIEELCRRTGFRVIGVFSYSVVSQLVAIRVLRWLKDKLLIFAPSETYKEGPGHIPGTAQADSGVKALLEKGLMLINSFVRYGIGRISPKVGPQTVIYVARKASLGISS